MYSPTCQKLTGKLKKGLLGGLLLVSGVAAAQVKPTKQDSVLAVQQAEGSIATKEKKSQWFEKISVKGYLQVRYSRLLETNPLLKMSNDNSVGDNAGFLIRRARITFSGDVHERVYIYIQPEFAASIPVSGSPTGHFVQLRDAYADLALDSKKEFRFRIGQSKVPFGFETVQSSSNRLSLERNDAYWSSLPNERDLGVFFYWAPKNIRERFKELANHKLKGTGDYGVFALGVYNGQTANRQEANDNLTIVSRISYPIQFSNGQIIEPGISGYTGRYNVGNDQLSSTKVKGGNFDDKRAAASFILYPKPLGFQAEYMVGKGPEFDPETSTIRTRNAHGGYAQVSYNLALKNQLLIPYVKVQQYEGGRKLELDARFGKTRQAEFGIEWQPIGAFELTTQYVISDRTTKDGRNLNNHQKGNFLQVQAQFNY